MRGLSRAAAANGYHILIADSAESVAEEMVLAVETRRRCDGLVLCAPRMPEADLARLLEELKPVVLINRDAGSPGTPVVAADHRTALTELLNLLYGYDHRSMVYLAGVPGSASNARRVAAVHDFLDDHADVRIQILPGGVTFDDGYAAAPRVLDSSATAVLAFNDLLATGLMGALSDQGVRGARTNLGRGIRRHPVRSLPDPALDDRIGSGRPSWAGTPGSGCGTC